MEKYRVKEEEVMGVGTNTKKIFTPESKTILFGWVPIKKVHFADSEAHFSVGLVFFVSSLFLIVLTFVALYSGGASKPIFSNVYHVTYLCIYFPIWVFSNWFTISENLKSHPLQFDTLRDANLIIEREALNEHDRLVRLEKEKLLKKEKVHAFPIFELTGDDEIEIRRAIRSWVRYSWEQDKGIC